MKILFSLVALFIIIFNVVNFGEAQCTPEKILMCCRAKCMDPYCDSVTSSCKCGSAQISKDQCSAAEEKCSIDKIKSCCTRKCKYPYCNLTTGRCECGDDKLSPSQCSSKG